MLHIFKLEVLFCFVPPSSLFSSYAYKWIPKNDTIYAENWKSLLLDGNETLAFAQHIPTAPSHGAKHAALPGALPRKPPVSGLRQELTQLTKAKRGAMPWPCCLKRKIKPVQTLEHHNCGGLRVGMWSQTVAQPAGHLTVLA